MLAGHHTTCYLQQHSAWGQVKPSPTCFWVPPRDVTAHKVARSELPLYSGVPSVFAHQFDQDTSFLKVSLLHGWTSYRQYLYTENMWETSLGTSGSAKFIWFILVCIPMNKQLFYHTDKCYKSEAHSSPGGAHSWEGFAPGRNPRLSLVEVTGRWAWDTVDEDVLSREKEECEQWPEGPVMDTSPASLCLWEWLNPSLLLKRLHEDANVLNSMPVFILEYIRFPACLFSLLPACFASV